MKTEKTKVNVKFMKLTLNEGPSPEASEREFHEGVVQPSDRKLGESKVVIRYDVLLDGSRKRSDC